MLGLRGIRFDELQILGEFTGEVPSLCGIIGELRATGTALIDLFSDSPFDSPDGELTSSVLEHVQAEMCTRLAHRLEELYVRVADLVSLVPLWRNDLSRRRALLLILAE